MIDERKGLPSASGFYRLVHCPGSWALESKLPPGPISHEANRGLRIHAALAGDASPDELNADEFSIYSKCLAHRQALLAKYMPDYDPSHSKKEKRIWLTDLHGKILMSGRLDELILHKAKALVIDYKTGRGDVEPEEVNMQLRCLATMVWRTYWGTQEVLVAIIQPEVDNLLPEPVRYTEEDCKYAEQEILGALAEAADPKAQLVPGTKQCAYCRAKLQCPALEKSSLAVASLTTRKLESMSIGQMSALMDVVPAVEKRCKEIRETFKARLEAGEESETWELGPGRKITEVTRISMAVAKLATATGKSHAEVVNGCCKLSLPSASESTGLSRKDLDELLAQTIETKFGEATLKRK